MTIDIITLFPEMFSGPFDKSIIQRAKDRSLVNIRIHNLRKWAIDKRGTVDDHPYGGGAGMLLRPEPIFNAVEDIKNSVVSNQTSVKQKTENPSTSLRTSRKLKTVLLDAGGKPFNQQKAMKFSKLDQLILICGHYEGVDYRVHKYLADEVISIGDYVLTGGELPAMVLVDSVVRLIPGVIEKESRENESFSNRQQKTLPNRQAGDNQQLVEYPQYTRPEVFNGKKVPAVLLSGNHAEIESWRTDQAKKRTKKIRPDLVK